MSAYYNEHDPKAAAWLRELIKENHIAAGEVDERSITDVQAADLRGFTQCHFFAGIGGWSLALRLAGVPDDALVWTGSCPCQPFSSAGKQLGAADERHLWPVFFDLILECGPKLVFGEQVANAIGKGWLDGVSADLESAGYACGATVLGAHSVGAPHMRQRLYWLACARELAVGPVANGKLSGLEGLTRNGDNGDEPGRIAAQPVGSVAASGVTGNGGMGNPDSECSRRDAGAGDCAERRASMREHCDVPEPSGAACGLGDAESGGCGEFGDAPLEGRSGHAERASGAGSGGMANSECDDRRADQPRRRPKIRDADECPSAGWSNYDIIPCRDGKARRIESGTFPLAHGVSGRVGLLRGYGNAIVPEVAAQFIQAGIEAIA